MPPTIVLFVIVVLVAVALIYGYRTVTALLILRSLPAADTNTSPKIVDGEPVSLTGEIVVEEPVTTASAVAEDTDRPIGAYLWRTCYSDNTNSDLTIEDWGWERQHWRTFASGIESGRFGVVAGGQTIRIDPAWLREAAKAESLERVEVGGTMKSDRLSVYLWDSWYTYLRNRTEHRSLRRFAGHVQRHHDDVDLDRYLLEAHPLFEGTTVSVSGELQVEQGEPVLRGTDDVPLLLSDEGFDGYRRWLWQQIIQKGGFAVGLFVVAVSLWFESYIPLGVLIIVLFVYIIYHAIQNVGVFLEFLKRLRR